MKKQLNFLKTIIFLLFILFVNNYSFAKIITDNEGNPDWKSKEAYRPSPIVFSHGFAAGSAKTDWAEEDGQPASQRVNMDVALSGYFNKYYCNSESETQVPILSLKDSRLPYLEIVSYIDFSKNKRSQLIDRNSSVDTYKMGDYYVYHYERNPGDPGWADKLNSAMTKVRDNYTDKNNYPLKTNIVCHSMGGLAAREYLTNSKYGSSQDKVRDLVLIGVPNKGSNCAIAGTVVTKTQETGWFIPEYGWLSSTVIKLIDKTLEVTLKIDIEGDAIRDMDPLFGSGFLKQLNSRSQPAGVDYYAICGKINKGFFNGIKNIIGDGVVPVDSQLGTGVLNLKDSTVIPAGHGDETRVIAQDSANLLIKFLDSEKPVVEITDPDPQSMEETYESSIKIKGKVSKEYLPADSLLQIEAVNQDTGEKVFETNSRELYPSDLWVPNDHNSVVAEFEQEIPLTAPGKYKITCKIENPAKVTSEVKEVWVKKLQIKGSNIIVHCHNPEGKEISSITTNKDITNRDITIGNAVKIYDGDNLIGYGVNNAADHGRPISLNIGNHTIKVKFNGMELVKDITLAQNETKNLIFEFKRTEFDIKNWLDTEMSKNYTSSVSGELQVQNSDPAINFKVEDKQDPFVYTGAFIRGDLYDTVDPSKNEQYSNVIYTATANFVFNGSSFNISCAASLSISGNYRVRLAYILTNAGSDRIETSIVNFPKNIITFTNWFIQSDKTGDYPEVSVGSFMNKIISNDYWNCNFISLPANENYVTGYLLKKCLSCVHPLQAMHPLPSYNQGSASISGTLNKVKMSNIPYDFDGKAI